MKQITEFIIEDKFELNNYLSELFELMNGEKENKEQLPQ